jgi:hypothetical protein
VFKVFDKSWLVITNKGAHMGQLFSKIILISGVLLCSISNTALSKSGQFDQSVLALVGTMEVVTEPYLQNGKVVGCFYRFNSFIIDEKYVLGSLLKVDGSVGILFSGHTPGGILKIVVNRLTSNDGQLRSDYSAPTRAYLVKSDYTTTIDKVVTAAPGDGEGSLFTVFDAVAAMEILAETVKDDKKLTVAFNQLNKESDIQFEIDLTVSGTAKDGSRQHSDAANQKFANCLGELSKKIQ